MPRASQYLLEGHVYHLTQRCHDRRFLLRFARDRDAYRAWWFEAVRRFRVPVYGYCITRNHVHAVAYVSDRESVSRFMHLASGSTAKAFNLRKGVEGSMWEHPYHCTIVETGRHLLNCLCYVDLNMVRAGVVEHPRDWQWCGHDELTGRRKRYRILDVGHLLGRLEMRTAQEFRAQYEALLEERLREGRLSREACWTESLAVGSRPFVEGLKGQFTRRRSLVTDESACSLGSTWTIREAPTPYAAVSPAQNES